MQKFMEVAIKEAKKALAEDEVPVGACIVLNGKIVAKAHNKKEKLSDPTAHAEILAIKKLAKKLKTWRLDGAIMFVTLEPCLMCTGAILDARISKVVFGTFDNKNGALGGALDASKIRNTNLKIDGGFMQEPCEQILKTYFKTKRGNK